MYASGEDRLTGIWLYAKSDLMADLKFTPEIDSQTVLAVSLTPRMAITALNLSKQHHA